MHVPITSVTVLAALFSGILGAYLAHRRGRSPVLWFAIGFFFGILGAFAIFFAPSKKEIPSMNGSAPLTLKPIIQGPSDKYWYYLNPDHSQIGPMSLDALTTAWRQGKISTSTYVWHEELPEWKLLQELITN